MRLPVGTTGRGGPPCSCREGGPQPLLPPGCGLVWPRGGLHVPLNELWWSPRSGQEFRVVTVAFIELIAIAASNRALFKCVSV